MDPNTGDLFGMQKAGAMLETIIVKERLQIQGTSGQIKQVAKGHKKRKASPKTPHRYHMGHGNEKTQPTLCGRRKISWP